MLTSVVTVADTRQVMPEVAHAWFARPAAEFLDHVDPGSVDATSAVPAAT